jgi:uncharacterized RDD family membrane protein YckC
MQEDPTAQQVNPQPSDPQPPTPPTPPASSDPAVDQTASSPTKDTPQMEYSSRLMRIAASSVDALLISFPIAGLVIAIFGDIEKYNWITGLLFMAYAVVALKYYSKTVGKHLFGLKVVKDDGGVLTWGNILIRETIGKILSSLVFSLGYLWILFDSKRQGWHDKLAKTVVIQERQPSKGMKTIAYIIVFALPALAILGILAVVILVAVDPAKQIERARMESGYSNSESTPTPPPVY